MYRHFVASAAMALMLTPSALHAEADTQRMVTVELGEMRAAIAAELDLPEPLLPREVAVPLDVAMEVCDPDAEEFAREAEAEQATCTAARGSPELTRAVDSKIVITGGPEGERLPGGAPMGDPGVEEDATGTDFLRGGSDEPGALPDGAGSLPDTTATPSEEEPGQLGVPGGEDGDRTPGPAPSELRQQLGPTSDDAVSPDRSSPGTAGGTPPVGSGTD